MTPPLLGPTGVAIAGCLATAVFLAVAGSTGRGDELDTERLEGTSAREFATLAVLTFGGLGAVVVVATVFASAFGTLRPETVGLDRLGPAYVAVGLVVGVGSYLLHRVLKVVLGALGLAFTDLFEELTPETTTDLAWYAGGHAVQATAEEVVFRLALVGALAPTLGVSGWTLVLPTAVVFALAHTGSGSGHVVDTGVLGVVLGVVFVEFGFLAVAVAHVTINATSRTVQFYESGGETDDGSTGGQDPSV